MDWGGLSEQSGFRARAGTLTLLMLASGEEAETVRDALEQLDAALFDPGADCDAEGWDVAGWDAEEWDEDEEWNEDEWDAHLPASTLPASTRRGLREVHYTARVLATWLRESPAGPLRLREEEGVLAVGALAAGWSSTVVHALSGAALTFAELEKTTGAVNRKVLQGHVTALEHAGLVELLEGPAGEVRIAPTPWLRRGVAPLAAATRHECRLRDPDSAPPDAFDVGAAFLLALPPVELPADLSGPCRLGVEMPRGGRRVRGHRLGMAGATAHVESGRVVAVDLGLEPWPESWATGGPLDWLDTVIDPSAERVDVGGGARLAEALIDGLHELLFSGPLPGPEDPRT